MPLLKQHRSSCPWSSRCCRPWLLQRTSVSLAHWGDHPYMRGGMFAVILQGRIGITAHLRRTLLDIPHVYIPCSWLDAFPYGPFRLRWIPLGWSGWFSNTDSWACRIRKHGEDFAVARFQDRCRWLLIHQQHVLQETEGVFLVCPKQILRGEAALRTHPWLSQFFCLSGRIKCYLVDFDVIAAIVIANQEISPRPCRLCQLLQEGAWHLVGRSRRSSFQLFRCYRRGRRGDGS